MQVSFATLLCRMKDYLTHQDVRTRQSAMELLNDLIWYQGSSGDILQEQEVPAFIEFVCSRLGDFPSVRMCLDVIKALLRHHALKLPPPAPVTIFKAILKELHGTCKRNCFELSFVHNFLLLILSCFYTVPSMEQSLRQRAFEVLDLLVASNTFISQLHDSSVDFTALFVESMEGEKDPRCLLICLRIVKLVLRNWGDSLQELAESVFDVTGCYFPVTFTPPPNDPHGIKKEHLVHALEDALTSHHCLATFVFPLALEKLSSTIPAAKMDALRLIRLGVQRYGLKTCDRFMRDICDAIRNEVTHCSDEQVINVALSTVSSITNEISADAEQAVLSTTDQRKLDYCTLPPATESGPTKSWDNFVLPCVKSSLEEIERAPDSLVGRSSGKLLLACAQGNGYALARVLRTSFPTVSGLYSSPTGSKPSIRAAALRLIVGFVACIDRGIDYRENEHPFQPWVDTVLNTVCSVLIHGNAKNQNEQGTLHAGGTMRESRSLALRGLRDLLLRPPSPLVSLDEHYKLTEHLCNILLNDVDPVIREKCVEALACLASEKGHIRDAISSVVLPRLAKAVNYPFLENIEPSRVDENVSIAVRALRAIPRLCVGSQLAFPVINQLTVLAMQGRQEVAILRPTNIDDSYINDVYEEELDSSSAEYGVVDLPLNLRYSGFILFTVGELLRRNQTDPEVIKTAVSGNSTSLIVRPDGSDEIPAESLLNTLLRLLAGLVSREQLPVKVCHNFISRTVTQLFRTIISNMDQTNLGLIYSDVVELLVPSDAQNNFSLLSLDIGAKIMNVVKDINVESCSLLQMLLVLLTYAPKECKTEIPRVSSLLQQLASIFMEVPTLLTQEQESQSKARIEAISDTIGRTLAAVLNRHVGILKTTQGSDCMRDSIDQLIEHFDPATTPRPMQAIKGLIWITKGLSMISHRCSKELLTRICQCITSSEFGENVRSIAAQGLGAVIRDEEPLSKGSGCYVNVSARNGISDTFYILCSVYIFSIFAATISTAMLKSHGKAIWAGSKRIAKTSGQHLAQQRW